VLKIHINKLPIYLGLLVTLGVISFMLLLGLIFTTSAKDGHNVLSSINYINSEITQLRSVDGKMRSIDETLEIMNKKKESQMTEFLVFDKF